jgi:hypothetical protein
LPNTNDWIRILNNMSELSTEAAADSLIQHATARTERIERAFHHVAAAIHLELADLALAPNIVDPAKQDDLAEFGQKLLELVKEGGGLLKEIIESGAVAVEENGGGLPLRITSPAEVLAELEAPSPNGDSATDGGLQDTGDSHETPEEEAQIEADSDVQPETALPCIDIIVDDDRMLTNKFLKLTHTREIELLQLLPKLDRQPLTRKWVMQHGFYSEGKTPVARNQAFVEAIASVTTNLEAACFKPVLEKVGIKGGTRYLVRSPMIINGENVAVSEDQVKKKT